MLYVCTELIKTKEMTEQAINILGTIILAILLIFAIVARNQRVRKKAEYNHQEIEKRRKEYGSLVGGDPIEVRIDGINKVCRLMSKNTDALGRYNNTFTCFDIYGKKKVVCHRVDFVKKID